MVLNVDLSLIIELSYGLDRLRQGEDNISDFPEIKLVGPGLELSKLLGLYNEESLLLTLLGRDGKDLIPGNINLRAIGIKDLNSRMVTVETDVRTRLISYSRILGEEYTELYNTYDRLMDDFDLVTMVEARNENIEAKVLKDLLRISKIREVPVILEVLDPANLAYLDEKPFMALVTREVLEAYTNMKITNEKSLIAATNYILRQGTENVLVNNFENGIIFSSNSNKYVVKSEGGKFKHRTNYGLMAGLVKSFNNNYDMLTSLRISHSSNMVYCEGEENIDMTSLKKYMQDIHIEKIYK